MKAVLFDLDGTLLPWNQDEFEHLYFKMLAKYVCPKDVNEDYFIKTMKHGVYAMINNDGTSTNETAFFDAFGKYFTKDKIEEMNVSFNNFYLNEFNDIKAICGFSEKANGVIQLMKENGITVIVATNPVFPDVATRKRLNWAGINPDDLALYTTYENSCYCKPSREYYMSILDKFSLLAKDCIMVGNDTGDDMVAKEYGMEVFLLTDRLVNRSGSDITQYPNGDFNDLENFLKNHLTM